MFMRRHPLSRAQQLRRLLWPRMGLRRQGRYYIIKVARIQGTPHSIALGMAAGVFMGLTPFIGLHVPLSMGLAWLLGARMMAGVVGTLIANPWTYPAIWFASYRLGCLLLGMSPGEGQGPDLSLTFLLDHPWQLFMPMLVGGGLLGAVLGPLTYLVAKPLIALYQQRRAERRRAAARKRLKG
ncbi:hypothetical protein SAMN05880556_101612 [Azospirillum sp. RU38E]|nr:hypothetical protein SAMN05880556_101612 [Azospirillum sp. RU38E]SNS09095.1 hypothetical protein SAMN05880591_101612 [Azospirillum sp. RU37A]